MELRPLTVRSKTRAPRSGGTPGPSSVTSTTAWLPVTRVRSATVPPPCISEFSISVASTWATAPGVPTARSRRLAGADDGPARAAVGRPPLLDLLLDDLVEVEGDGGAGARVAGVGQQPLDDVREPLDLRQRDGRLLLHGVRVVGEGDLLQPHGQRGQRRTQLVGGVGGQPPLGGQHPGDALGAGVQHVGDPVQLRDAVAAVARARVAGAEPLGGLGEVGERRGEPVGLADGEEHGGDDREQRHRQDDQQRAADLAR